MGDDDPVSRKLRALAEEVAASLAERMTGIEAAYEVLAVERWPQQAMTDLHAALHSLAGTTGSFGYLKISQAARGVLNTLEPVMVSDCQAGEELRRSLQDAMSELRREVADPVAEEGWL